MALIQLASARVGIRPYGRRVRSPAVVLPAFLVGLVFVIAGTADAAVRGVRLWRQVKRTNATFSSQLETFDEKAARAERHLAEWERSSRELDLALERLRVSRARLQVLLDALERAQARIRWLRVFLPR